MATPHKMPRTLYCSFCGKSEYEVQKLIADEASVPPTVLICDECVGRCSEIIAEENQEKEDAQLPIELAQSG